MSCFGWRGLGITSLCTLAAVLALACGATTHRDAPDASGGTVGSGGASVISGGAPLAHGGSNAGASAGRGSAVGGAPTGGANNAGGSAGLAAWSPPVKLGDPGWRASEEPICDPRVGRASGVSVWSDARGVFVLLSDECLMDRGDMPSCIPATVARQGSALNFNDGSGWRVLSEVDTLYSDSARVTGFPDGAVIVSGVDCAARLLELPGGKSTCSLPLPADGASGPVFVVNSDLAYTTDAAQLWEFNAGSWSVVAAALPEAIQGLWANGDIVYLAGDYQLYSWQKQRTKPFLALPNAPAARYTSVWGFANDDVWFGNSAGQLVHYDGASFAVLDAVGGAHEAVRGLWGQDEQLFFHSLNRFGRVVADQPELLLAPQSDQETLAGSAIRGIWGNSPDEVFLALSDDGYDRTACGGRFMLWFDGTSFHRF